MLRCREVPCNPPDSLLLTCITSPDAAGKREPWANNPLNYWTQKNWKYIKCVINYSPSSMHYWLSKMKQKLGLCFPHLSSKEQQKGQFLSMTLMLMEIIHCFGGYICVWSTMFMPRFPSFGTHFFQAGLLAPPHWLRLFWGKSNALNGLSDLKKTTSSEYFVTCFISVTDWCRGAQLEIEEAEQRH